MALLKSLIIAFSMYSKVPMPRVDWNEKNIKYSLLFFPFVGALIGCVTWFWWRIAEYLSYGDIFRSAVALFIPILITGGIHVDGLLDTLDGLHSYQSKERKLEILKDPHTGAFAVFGCTIYFILYFGAVTEIRNQDLWILIAIGFVLSRTLSGLSLVFFKAAKKEGLLYTFSSTAHRKITGTTLCAILLICIAAMVSVNLMLGSILVISAAIVFIYYRYMSYKQFGGITGDLAGYFLQICELTMIIELALLSKFIY